MVGSLSVSPTPPPVTVVDESSELTHGKVNTICIPQLTTCAVYLHAGLSHVICGNPVRALRARKQHGLSSQSSVGSSAYMSYMTTLPCYPGREQEAGDSLISHTQDQHVQLVVPSTIIL